MTVDTRKQTCHATQTSPDALCLRHIAVQTSGKTHSALLDLDTRRSLGAKQSYHQDSRLESNSLIQRWDVIFCFELLLAGFKETALYMTVPCILSGISDAQPAGRRVADLHSKVPVNKGTLITTNAGSTIAFIAYCTLRKHREGPHSRMLRINTATVARLSKFSPPLATSRRFRGFNVVYSWIGRAHWKVIVYGVDVIV
ncbi:hypothetical protein BDY19DRAFT_1046581 [Irpex rosettiformis]|uniref:Uncharacterized protein n=1 Tax=Irpex rosettiformis TaxID=378272 RepID=A0ACB8UBJ3_9APHY|nr:hypothetical protein BDY19DRAFT_1046581 [Irpex rosettiformis]